MTANGFEITWTLLAMLGVYYLLRRLLVLRRARQRLVERRIANGRRGLIEEYMRQTGFRLFVKIDCVVMGLVALGNYPGARISQYVFGIGLILLVLVLDVDSILTERSYKRLSGTPVVPATVSDDADTE